MSFNTRMNADRKRMNTVVCCMIGVEDKDFACDRVIRAKFGASISVLMKLCKIVEDSDDKIKIHHFLWGMIFLKCYPSNDVVSREVGCSPKTFRKWLWRVVETYEGSSYESQNKAASHEGYFPLMNHLI